MRNIIGNIGGNLSAMQENRQQIEKRKKRGGNSVFLPRFLKPGGQHSMRGFFGQTNKRCIKPPQTAFTFRVLCGMIES